MMRVTITGQAGPDHVLTVASTGEVKDGRVDMVAELEGREVTMPAVKVDIEAVALAREALVALHLAEVERLEAEVAEARKLAGAPRSAAEVEAEERDQGLRRMEFQPPRPEDEAA